MRRRGVARWGLVLGLVTGCPGSEEAASGSADRHAEPETPWRHRRADPDAEPRGPVRAAPEETPDTTPNNVKPETVPEWGVYDPKVESSLEAHGAPDEKSIREASRLAVEGESTLLAPGAYLGSHKIAVAVGAVWEGDPGAADIAVIVMRAGVSPRSWVHVDSHVVHHVAVLRDEEDPPPIPTTLEAVDYDDDGMSELALQIREDIMCPGGGPNTITRLFILNRTKGLPIALATELHHSMGANPTETKAKVTHEDLDGDGHRDVRIVYTTTDPEEGKATKEENRWLWKEADDRWRLDKPGYERWGCDW